MTGSRRFSFRPARNPLEGTRWSVLLVAITACLLDQITKNLALNFLSEGKPTPLLGTFIQLRLIYNSGAALSFLENKTWIVTILSLVVVTVIGILSLLTSNRVWALTLGIVFGSGTANLYDRFFRPPYWGNGHVVDFIDYSNWFIGNVADIFIVLGVIVILYLLWRQIPLFTDSKTTKLLEQNLECDEINHAEDTR